MPDCDRRERIAPETPYKPARGSDAQFPFAERFGHILDAVRGIASQARISVVLGISVRAGSHRYIFNAIM
jgi:hypothetical protein